MMHINVAPWHDTYTLPSLYAYYAPSRTNHGSYWYDWTTGTRWRGGTSIACGWSS